MALSFQNGLSNAARCVQAINAMLVENIQVQQAANITIIDLSQGVDVGNGSKPEVPNCPICMEDIKGRAALMECGHMFDEECVLKWLESKNSCPICRQPVAT